VVYLQFVPPVVRAENQPLDFSNAARCEGRLVRDASVLDADIGVNPIDQLFVNTVEVVIDQVVDLLQGEGVFRIGDVVGPFPKGIGVLSVTIGSRVVHSVSAVMKAVIVLHATLAGAELHLPLDQLDDGIEPGFITDKEQVLCQYTGNHNAIPTRPGSGCLHVGSADNGLRLFHHVRGQLVAHDQHEVHQVGRCRDLVVMPIVPKEIVLHPVTQCSIDPRLQPSASEMRGCLLLIGSCQVH